MTFGVYIVIALLIITKSCDALSTHQRLTHSQSETNPIARGMMRRLGTGRAIWFVFALAVFIIIVSGVAAIRGGILMMVLFILIGAVISVTQGAVAHCNWTGRDNRITKQVRALHASLHRYFPG